MTKRYWVGVKNRPPQTVIHDIDDNITKEKYPQYSYMLGPYDNKKEAEKASKEHVNIDGTFNDPFCNSGGGR